MRAYTNSVRVKRNFITIKSSKGQTLEKFHIKKWFFGCISVGPPLQDLFNCSEPMKSDFFRKKLAFNASGNCTRTKKGHPPLWCAGLQELAIFVFGLFIRRWWHYLECSPSITLEEDWKLFPLMNWDLSRAAKCRVEWWDALSSSTITLLFPFVN